LWKGTALQLAQKVKIGWRFERAPESASLDFFRSLFSRVADLPVKPGFRR
jgi:hypothetical protein